MQDYNLSYPHYGVLTREMHFLVPTTTPSQSNSLVFQFAIPSMVTIP